MSLSLFEDEGANAARNLPASSPPAHEPRVEFLIGLFAGWVKPGGKPTRAERNQLDQLARHVNASLARIKEGPSDAPGAALPASDRLDDRQASRPAEAAESA